MDESPCLETFIELFDGISYPVDINADIFAPVENKKTQDDPDASAANDTTTTCTPVYQTLESAQKIDNPNTHNTCIYEILQNQVSGRVVRDQRYRLFDVRIEEESKSLKRQWTHKRKSKPVLRNNRLWEFIRDLLLNPLYNPSLICWTNRYEGEFRLINSALIAKLWGERKNNKLMTYEKLSRALRYYYKRGILVPVLGKRLVYRFGTNASGWKVHVNQ